MKALKLVVRYIRLFFGYMFLFMAGFVLPDRSEVLPKKGKEQEPVVKKPVLEEDESEAAVKPIPFTDLASYASALTEPQDRESSIISILNDLRRVSDIRKGPVRLNLITTVTFNAGGEESLRTMSSICGYDKNRWHELKKIHLDHSAMSMLTREMVEVMAQDGWMCMNDSVEQLALYIYHCMDHNSKYMVDHCRQRNTTGTIRTVLSFVIDVTEGAGKNTATMPQIQVRMVTSIKDRNPTESTHNVYFARKEATTHAQ